MVGTTSWESFGSSSEKAHARSTAGKRRTRPRSNNEDTMMTPLEETMTTSLAGMAAETRGYAPVNGLKMYYEIEGEGDPLVHIPAAFGYAGLKSFRALTQSHSVITMDLQGHGRTADIPDRPLTIAQYAKDVVGLLKHLGVAKADFFGESYGGVAAIVIAVR